MENKLLTRVLLERFPLEEKQHFYIKVLKISGQRKKRNKKPARAKEERLILEAIDYISISMKFVHCYDPFV